MPREILRALCFFLGEVVSRSKPERHLCHETGLLHASFMLDFARQSRGRGHHTSEGEMAKRRLNSRLNCEGLS